MVNMRMLVAVVALFLLVGAAVFIWQKYPNLNSEPGAVACTMEAKICPDGSYVGRTGPNCEFATCPASESSRAWLTYSGSIVSFKYPENLGTEYARATEWPPKVTLQNENFVCIPGGTESSASGETRPVKVADRGFCITKTSEGAAGSVYTSYVYRTIMDDDTNAALSFTVQKPQCENYDEPNRSVCKTEQGNFDPNNLANEIIKTLRPVM